jgi:hypothetical protein
MLRISNIMSATTGKFRTWRAPSRNTQRYGGTPCPWNNRGAGNDAEPCGGDDGNGRGGSPEGPRASRADRLASALVLAALASSFGALFVGCKKEKKDGESDRSEAMKTAPMRPKTIPRDAYIIGKSNVFKLPKSGRPPRWRVARLKKQAQRRAKAELENLRKKVGKTLSSNYPCRMKTVRVKTIRSLDRRVSTINMRGAQSLYYEHWILWKHVVCSWSFSHAYGIRTEKRYHLNSHVIDQ